jgi:hypothetical protein
MIEPQQSELYAKYIKKLGWNVLVVDHVNIFSKQIPLMGGLAKIHRPKHLPVLSKLIPVLKKNRIKTVAVEPPSSQDPCTFHAWTRELAKHFNINKSPFLPTKTIRIDLTQPEEKIFAQFAEAKRRGVRRAIKHGVVVKESIHIDDLIRIKNKSAGLFGFMTTYGINRLWHIFAPKHAAILLAHHQPVIARSASDVAISKGLLPFARNDNLIGGVLLLSWGGVAYYWIAGATKQGKKLFAPTILVWEAIKLSKKRGNRLFDFVGVWDERTPRQYSNWKGFTKFKEGFGGSSIYYPPSFPVSN